MAEYVPRMTIIDSGFSEGEVKIRYNDVPHFVRGLYGIFDAWRLAREFKKQDQAARRRDGTNRVAEVTTPTDKVS